MQTILPPLEGSVSNFYYSIANPTELHEAGSGVGLGCLVERPPCHRCAAFETDYGLPMLSSGAPPSSVTLAVDVLHLLTYTVRPFAPPI